MPAAKKKTFTPVELTNANGDVRTAHTPTDQVSLEFRGYKAKANKAEVEKPAEATPRPAGNAGK